MDENPRRCSGMEYVVSWSYLAMQVVTLSSCWSISWTSNSLGLDERYPQKKREKRTESIESLCLYWYRFHRLRKRRSKSHSCRWFKTNHWLGTEKSRALRTPSRYDSLDTRGCREICRARSKTMKHIWWYHYGPSRIWTWGKWWEMGIRYIVSSSPRKHTKNPLPGSTFLSREYLCFEYFLNYTCEYSRWYAPLRNYRIWRTLNTRNKLRKKSHNWGLCKMESLR